MYVDPVGWIAFWAVVAVGLALMWFSPYLRRRNRPPVYVGKPGSSEGAPSEASVRSGAVGRGAAFRPTDFGGS